MEEEVTHFRRIYKNRPTPKSPTLLLHLSLISSHLHNQQSTKPNINRRGKRDTRRLEFVWMLNMAINGVVSARRWKSESEIDFRPSIEAHVLAVDDSLIDRKVIERLLRTSSCKVTAVDSGMRALEFLGLDEQQRSSVVDGLKVDLIITDYCMPGMTGYELLKRIKESSTFKETPVVIMSSENVMARIDRCLEEGAEDFILKPVKLSDVKRLRDYMSREDRSERKESGINKRKERDGSDLSSLSPPSSRSSPSDSPMSPDSQSLPSVSSSPSLSPSPSQSSSTSTPSSPSSPPSDSPLMPSSPSGPLDSPILMPYSPSDPLESPTRLFKMTTNSEEVKPISSDLTALI